MKKEIKIDHMKPFINKLQWHIILYLELPCVSGSRKHDFLHENIRSMRCPKVPSHRTFFEPITKIMLLVITIKPEARFCLSLNICPPKKFQYLLSLSSMSYTISRIMWPLGALQLAERTCQVKKHLHKKD